jgi:endonuclease/exonuclease/phosphatase family metal-dependent hydrolase
VISRFPIAAAGEWDDPVLDNRDFVWARLALPGGRRLWAVSVHLHSRNAATRQASAKALLAHLQRHVPAADPVVLGGDFNTRHFDEPCLATLAARFVRPDPWPACSDGLAGTNAPRNRPYDLVLACPRLHARAVPVQLAGRTFPHGLVFDTRTFPELAKAPPAQLGDSGLPQMQHMAVVRDFLLP